MNMPYVSACVLCGAKQDAPAAAFLFSAIRSLVDRPRGPAVDEIVIWFNSPDGTARPSATWVERISCTAAPVPISWHFGIWNEDFGATRQASFDAAQGTWRIAIDTDDVLFRWEKPLADAFRLQVPDANRLQGSMRLQDYLRGLEGRANGIMIPVFESDNTFTQIETLVWQCRIVHRDSGWRWIGRIHNVLLAPSLPHVAINAGCAIWHRPIHNSMRTARDNRRLVRLVDQNDPRALEIALDHAIAREDWPVGLALALRAVEIESPFRFRTRVLGAAAADRMGRRDLVEKWLSDNASEYPDGTPFFIPPSQTEVICGS